MKINYHFQGKKEKTETDIYKIPVRYIDENDNCMMAINNHKES